MILLRANRPDTDNPRPVPSMHDVEWPKHVIIREIDFRVEENNPGPGDDELIFFYSNFSPDRLVRSQAEFDALLREVNDPHYVFTGGGPSLPKLPFTTMLSLDSKERLACLLFKLSPRNWQFARNGPPVKIGPEGEAAGVYRNARRVDRNGVAESGADPYAVIENCKLAYFISDGRHVPAAHPYPHPFNFYVNILFSGLGGGYMPLALDPDVRHPGGSMEPDEGGGPVPFEGEGVDI